MGVSSPKTTSAETEARGYGLVAIPPEPFDKYTLIGKLGHGGMAEVNLAVAEGKGGFRKLTVIKRLHGHLAHEPGFIDMFLDEARLAAKLNHPHCVQTYEVGESNGNHFLAMEYLDGQGLERLLRISGQQDVAIPPEVTARIVADALDGLGYAHELTDFDGTPLRVVHRDVSPQNIFITYNGVVKLLDFGIAKAASHIVETRTGVIKGKYAYIAPEQALAQEVDHRADLWSMGVVLWEMLTGRRLFKSANELATLNETLHAEIKLPSSFEPELPAELDTICLRALQRDPAQRYQSAHEMKEDLERFLHSLPRAPGRKQIARLMSERFDPIREAHKTVLAQCLQGTAITASSIQRIVDVPGGQSVTPTPTPAAPGVILPPTPAVPAEVRQEKRRTGVLWTIAVLLLAILIAGVVAFVLPPGSDGPATTMANGPTRQEAPREIAVEPPEPSEPPGVAAVAPEPAIEPTREPALEPTAPSVEPALEPTATSLDPASEPAAEPAAPAEVPRAETRTRPRHHHRPAPPDSPDPPAPAATGAPGYLTLATTPWTQVRLGARDLGTTPLIRVELPPGTHTLSLSNPEAGINTTYRVTIEPGQAVTRRLGLQ